jgi:predicted RNA-binding protein
MKTMIKKSKIYKIEKLVKSLDEVVDNNFNKYEYASEEYKTNQRISNKLYHVIRALSEIKEEF